MAFEMARELAEAEGIKVGDAHRRRRRRGEGLDLHGRSTRRRRKLLRDQGGRRGRGAGATLEELVALGERVNVGDPHDGHGAQLVHAAREGLAAVRARRGRDGGRRRHPRRTGPRREKLAAANEIIDELLDAVVTDLPYQKGDDVALMINGLGGTPIGELYIVYGRAQQQLAAQGSRPRAMSASTAHRWTWPAPR